MKGEQTMGGGAGTSKNNPEENTGSDQNFGEQHGKEHGSVVTAESDNTGTASEDQPETSKYTPKTSNKRVVTIQRMEGVQHPPSSSATNSPTPVHEQESLLPFRNPLHNNDDDEEGGITPTFESHFEVDMASDHDLRPVAPTRRASDESFQKASAKVTALEREIHFINDHHNDENVKVGKGGEDSESVASSYVGDVDERNLEERDIQFQPEGYLRVEPMLPPKQGSFKMSSVHTEATSTMSASGMTTSINVVPLLSECTSSGGREINFSPGASDIQGPADPKHGSFRGNIDDMIGNEDEDSGIPSASNVKAAAAEDNGLADTSILDMEKMLDAALDDDVIVAEGPAADELAGAENPLSESNIPSESFFKMGAMMQSQLESSGKLDKGLVGELSNKMDIDDVINDVLEEGLIIAGEREGDLMKVSDNTKDEHDDLLDSMLGDDDFEESHKDAQSKVETYVKDPDGDVIETMLGDKEPVAENQEEYVPDEEIRILEALLDEGLVGHENISAEDKAKAIEESQRLEIEASDSMAKELDALLDGDLEEEVSFDVVETRPYEKQPSKTRSFGSSDVKSPAIASTKRKPKITETSTPNKAEESRQRKPGVPRFFKQQAKPQKIKEQQAEKMTSKKNRMFGSGVAKRASNSVKKRFSPKGSKEISAQTEKSRVDPSSGAQSKKAAKTPVKSFTSTTLKRFMSPTIAFKRHIALAVEDRASKHDNTSGTPTYGSPKPSWRSSKKSFMSSTFSSLRKLRSSSFSAEEREHRKERRNVGDAMNPDGTKSRITGAFMEPTFSKIMLETETRIAEERKALAKEEEAKKIIVDLSPRGDRKLSPFLDYSYQAETSKELPKVSHTPIQQERKAEATPSTTPRRRIVWTPNGMASPTKKDVPAAPPTPVEPSPHSVFSPRSLGSLTSQCSIRSFVSPDKAGVIGCQSKYNPYLYNMKSPCELCVFQLSDEERDELDAHGRHLMVQFTTGGCPECLEFPRSYDEAPVRLCPRCYSISHRPKQSRRRKKGNDAARIGYTFAKKEYV